MNKELDVKYTLGYTDYVIRFDKPTSAGRLYSREVLEKAMAPFFEAKVRTDGGWFLYGQFASDIGDGGMALNVDIERVSHKIVDIWFDNIGMKARVEVLNTPQGKLLQDLIATSALTARGMLKSDVEGRVTEYNLITIDMVHHSGGVIYD